MEEFEEYRKRMLERSRQFRFFGIQPVWHPGQEDIDGFIHDEVVRQFHDTRVRDDGGIRIEGMTRAWNYAMTEMDRAPAVRDVHIIGNYVEPKYNIRGGEFRHENVYIGDRMGVYPPYLTQAIELLMKQAKRVNRVLGTARSGFLSGLMIEDWDEQAFTIENVDEFYLAFEWIHPFRDGNGRTGKILHNWLSGTLADPVLVPDYFGGGNP